MYVCGGYPCLTENTFAGDDLCGHQVFRLMYLALHTPYPGESLVGSTCKQTCAVYHKPQSPSASETHQPQTNKGLKSSVSGAGGDSILSLTLLAIHPLHPVAIHAHSKPTPRAHPVKVENSCVTHITHFSNTFDSPLPSNLSCKNQLSCLVLR